MMDEHPHVPAAFINAIREEGTKAEAIDWLQKTWNERCALSARVAQLEEALDDMLLLYGDKYDSECRLKDANELAVIAKARASLSEKEARG